MKLTHPDSDQVIEPKVEHADEYKTQGWVEVNETPAAVPEPKGK